MIAGEPRQDISDSFAGARDVLESIAERSPQAKTYHDILTTMGEAVAQYRRRESLEARRNVQHYMSQVLVVDVGGSSASPNDLMMGGADVGADVGAGAGDGRYLMQNKTMGAGDSSNLFDQQQQQQQSVLGLAGYEDGGDHPPLSQPQKAGSLLDQVRSGMAKQSLSPFPAQDLLITPTSDPPAPSAVSFDGGSGSNNVNSGGPAMSMYGGGSGGNGHLTDSILDDLQIDWGDLDLQLSDDSKLFESGPFETLFYSIE